MSNYLRISIHDVLLPLSAAITLIFANGHIKDECDFLNKIEYYDITSKKVLTRECRKIILASVF